MNLVTNIAAALDAADTQARGGWGPIESAPKDGTEIRIKLRQPRGLPAYWDEELRTFVLSRPLHVESIHDPDWWQPIAPLPEPAPQEGEI